MTQFEPFSDYVLIERCQESSTGIQDNLSTPDSAIDKPQEGIVLATGPGYLAENGERIPNQASIGMHVLFGKHAGTETRIEGKPCLLMRDVEILGQLVDDTVFVDASKLRIPFPL